jgi:hypothetical protein
MTAWNCIVSVLATIGAVVTALFVMDIAREFIRAARNAGRVATVYARAYERRRKCTWREWWFAFRRELTSPYYTLRIGGFEIPRDPSEPIRGVW